MKRLLAFAFAFFAFFAVEAAAARISPALWRLSSPNATVVMMGSVHVLPPNTNWQSDNVRRAAQQADVFVFEVPTDDSTGQMVAQTIAARGRLPEGQTLHGMLSPSARLDLDHVLEKLNLPAATLDGVRPWLATLMIDQKLMTDLGQTSPGPDFSLAAEAAHKGKEIRYLETAEQQIALLAPEDPKVELEFFESSLKDFDDPKTEVDRLTNAWKMGDVAAIAALSDAEFAEYPQAKAYFLDDRTKAWADKIAVMAQERKTFFVVVGMAHMVGANGLPALLRAKGFTVDGP